MSTEKPGNKPDLYTIGHSNHDLERFSSLIADQGIELVVDVRTSPYSKFSDHFNKDQLKAWLESRGYTYLFMGEALGGLPEGAEYYDGRGRVLYYRVAESKEFREGITRLLEKARGKRTVLLCSEEDPNQCHRRLLISRVLFERGVAVAHILGDGGVRTEEELIREEDGRARQMSLFDEVEEDQWKSTRSVSPKRAPGSSSKP